MESISCSGRALLASRWMACVRMHAWPCRQYEKDGRRQRRLDGHSYFCVSVVNLSAAKQPDTLPTAQEQNSWRVARISTTWMQHRSAASVYMSSAARTGDAAPQGCPCHVKGTANATSFSDFTRYMHCLTLCSFSFVICG
jgi:hypothetical protein